MSDPLASTDAPALGSPHPSRRRAVWAIASVLVVALLVGIAMVIGGRGHHRSSTSSPVTTPTLGSAARDHARLAATRILLRRRATAIVGHDKAAFMATVDPRDASFRRRESRMFTNLAKVTFASWTYQVAAVAIPVSKRLRSHYAAPIWAPTTMTLHYRIKGFDTNPTDLPQYPTFVERGRRWYLGSLANFNRPGHVSDSDLWDYGPVEVVHARGVLVLGPPSERATMQSVAATAAASIPRVTAVWGSHWSRRVVVQVPATQHEMGLITADPGDLNQIAALTSAEVHGEPGHPAPVGDRVTINPATWTKIGLIGAAVVLTHEFTHVATRAETDAETPKWLSEGFADYIGFLTSGVPVTIVATELVKDLQSGRRVRALPTNRDFAGSNKRLPQAYESGWLACRYIAAHFGQHTLVRFYRAVGTSPLPTGSAAVAHALHAVLGETPAGFTRAWRGYVRAQLG